MSRLSDAEIERLDAYLAEHCAGAGGLPDSEALDGLLSAVVVAPAPLPPSAWTPSVWGSEHAFEDMAVAAEMLGLVMRAHNVVVARIADPASAADEPGDAVLPLIAWPEFDPDDPDDAPDMDDTSLAVGALWAYGFSVGRALGEAAWTQRLDDWEGLEETLLDIDDLMLGLDEQDPEDEKPCLGERLAVLQLVPALLHDLYRDAQTYGPPPPPPFRRDAPKVGRNDPCPCGSGRKYKHCHGRN